MKLNVTNVLFYAPLGAVTAQIPARNPVSVGPPLELMHLYFDEWPTRVAVSASGRMFSCYPLGLDYTNTRYQVAELGSNNTEIPFPSAQVNSPPGGAVNYSTYPPTTKGLLDYLMSVQSVAVDPKDHLWILDTGRALLSNGTLTTSNLGGPKLTGGSWPHLENIPQVRAEPGFYVNVRGDSVYMNAGSGMPISKVAFGADGITLSNDGDVLRASSELFAAASVMDLGQKGVSDGLDSDSNGIVYAGSVETDSNVTFNHQNGTVQTYVRDPRIGWTDTFSVAGNYLYFTENQLWRGASYQSGIDMRVKPYASYRVPLLNNATKIQLV
ncbi:hypothetical protein Z517_00224 [Fonsecaea pedrosoi CBS 271.37]|uniref:Major royal jelly protein n=1 Tax=Fonsecaea pedrosoi CBS 271.37 TaxID=1442368 RepID=A0A0D2E419_9EURO|nr:uncharacterized protein Z517_00224 [Fonsecaea pedrosoi CBS 271.37]KIW84836.1 hypothetical protein Z517_00224 [Fonsecaea pedrosoi CBS 271.37]